MALEDDIRILDGVGLLKDFSHEQLRLLAFGAENMRLSAGRELYAQDAPADCAYVVASGTIDLVRSRDGIETVIASAGPRTMLGEYALIAGGTRPTAAVARDDAEIIRLNRNLFRRILEEYPDLAMQLHERVSSDMHGLIAGIEKLAPRFGDD